MEILEDRCLLSAGQLDPTFGSGGIATTNFGNNLSTASSAIALQPADGKIVEAGSSINAKSPNVGYIDLVRYNSNGSLDTSFGSGGTVQTKVGYRPYIRGMTLQPDGKIVVAGWEGGESLLARYNSNGTLDATFGSKGIVLTAFGSYGGASAWAVTTETVNGQTDILTVGGVSAGATGDAFALARYTPNGSLDTSFGNGGTVVTQVSGGNADLAGVAIQADGKIVATGGGGGYFTLARYNGNGTLDSTFGSGGLVQTTFLLANGTQAGGAGHAIAVQPNGEIVAAGNLNNEAAVVRYNPDGSLDSTFGQGGMVLESQPSNFGTIALTSTGQIVVGGAQIVDRLNADGTPDQSFGNGGAATVNLGRGAIMDLALQADGNIVIGAGNSFEVARILGS
jgi:uncharacterized delta-60 repeat protein